MTKRKLIVMIPTRDRPQYLHATLKSVCEQASEHRHEIEIVVSDTSVKKAGANARIAKKLGKTFGIPIHYYRPGRVEIIESALKRGSEEERHAFSQLVPADGHWGAARNRLTLLAARHGGKNSLYLHLDDDMPLYKLDEKRRIVKNPEDVIGNFLSTYENAKRAGCVLVAGSIVGVSDSTVSGSLSSIVKKVLAKEIIHPVRSSVYSARLAEFDATIPPYQPYGRNSDITHENLVRSDVGKIRNTFTDTQLTVLHIGASGFTPQNLSFSRPIRQHLSDWLKLVERMTRYKKT